MILLTLVVRKALLLNFNMSTNITSISEFSVLSESGTSILLSSLFHSTTLCIFVRHWGCAECNLLLHTLIPRLQELVDLNIGVILVGLGSAEGISEFRSKHKLNRDRVHIVTDPTLSIHKAVGLERGLWQVQGPKGFFYRMKLKLEGFPNDTSDGDQLQQGGALLFDAQKKIIWKHQNNHFGDILDTNEMMNAVLKASVMMKDV